MIERLKDVPAAQCLRVRCCAIQSLMSAFPNTRSLEHMCCLWMDHHAPLMLALENAENPHLVDATATELEPSKQSPILPRLPTSVINNLPLLWAARSAHVLKKHPILRLLWKAAPRKTHSADVSKIILELGNTSKNNENIILTIYRSSMLGNYM